MSLVSFSDNFGQFSYTKIIYYSGSIFAHLNNTMQTKEHTLKKRTHIQIETGFTRGLLLCLKYLFKCA